MIDVLLDPGPTGENKKLAKMARVTRMARTVARMARWLADFAGPFCVICSVASTRGLRRISFAILLSSLEISAFFETATHKAVKIQEELSLP